MPLLMPILTPASDAESIGEEVTKKVRKQMLDRIPVYVLYSKRRAKPVERLIRQGSKQDRSVNYLVVEAILQHLEREDG